LKYFYITTLYGQTSIRQELFAKGILFLSR